MGYKSDIEIAQECEMLPITQIAEKAGIDDKYLEQYGKYKAKIDYNLLKESDKKDGKLILVTAINPTPAGEGKTTTTVGLADGMQRLGKSAMVALREPSLGPVFLYIYLDKTCLLLIPTDHSARTAYSNHIVGNIFCYNTACSNHNIIPDGNAR